MAVTEPQRYQVSRDQIVRSARAAIASTRREGYEVETPLVRKLMRIARTRDAFAMGSWWVGECGCLIGWLYDDEVEGDALDATEGFLGVRFDTELLTATGHDQYAAPAIVEVAG